MTSSRAMSPTTGSLQRRTSWTAEDGEVFDLVYDQLRKIASRQLGRYRGCVMLETTEVLHEAYLKIATGTGHKWRDRAHFLAYCASAMRHVLVDLIRERTRVKRGSGSLHLRWDDVAPIGVPVREQRRDSQKLLDVLAVHEALDALADIDPEAARVVELRYFGGLWPAEIAAALGISASTAQRRWRVARAWLFERLSLPS